MPPLRMPDSPPPPEFPEADRIQDFFQFMAATRGLVNGKYYHWDKLRHLTPPAGWTGTQWWTALGSSRRAGSQFVNTFHDKLGQPFRFVQVEPVQRALHEIDSSARGRIQAPEPIVNEQTRNRYIVSSLIEEAVTSSQLEGATTTRRVARQMIRTGRKPRDRSERMILNNYITMQRIRALRDSDLTPALICELHAIVTKGTLDTGDAAGRFRTSDEHINIGDNYGNVYHVPPPASELAKRVQRMCDFANGGGEGFVHPVLRAIIVHFWLAYDHPFVDGNGRTARALFYWCMLKNDYWMFEFVSISRRILESPVQYARAYLLTETDHGDLTYFILYHLKVIDLSIKELHAYIVRKTNEVRASVAQLAGMRALNSRQKALVTHALKSPGAEYTIKSHQNSHDVTYQTARTDLLGLNERGLLERTLLGRQYLFAAAPELGEILTAKTATD